MQSTIEKPKVVEKIPIGLIWPNPENPRSHINPEAVQKLAANLKVTGQRTPVKFVPLTEGERSANPGCEYKLLGGHLRREAALSLGW
ncbi:MAG TPA: ParB N-terminal domain-containing protein, partial [bacterium]